MTQKNDKYSEGEVIIFGASGHAKVVIDILEKQELYTVKYLIDSNPSLKGKDLYGYKIIGDESEISSDDKIPVLVAIGDNQVRAKVTNWLEANNFILANAAIHPSSQLARGVSIGTGSVAMAGSVVNSDTIIGKNTIINTGATIDHDCIIGETVHVAPGSVVCGGVSVGDLTLIGAGAVIHPNITIGKNVIVGAGATVLKDIEDGSSVVGTPAEVIA